MTTLVTGATGNIGRLVVDHLIELGVNDIRALTKNPARANLPKGVTVATGYLGEPDSLPAAFDGVDSMYLAPLPSTAAVMLELAKKAGIDYGVALSGGAHWQEHSDTVAASGLAHTQLGPGEFPTTSRSGRSRSRPAAPFASPTRMSSRPRCRWTTSRAWPPRCWPSRTRPTTTGCTS